MLIPLYRTAMRLGRPAIERLLARRCAHGREDLARLGERRGETAARRPPGRLIWLHAASVGESVAALGLIRRLLEPGPAPSQDFGPHSDGGPPVSVLVTTGTVSSARLLADRLPAGARHQYAPVDRGPWVRRFLDHWRPDLGIVVESDFWPNLVLGARRRGVPLAAVSARLSDRSYTRWRLSGGAGRTLFGAFDVVMATNLVQADRFRRLGAREVLAAGNLKLTAPPPPADEAGVRALVGAVGARPLWLAASTHPGEEEAVIAAHRQAAAALPGLLTVIVPRHPERGDAVAALAAGAGLAARRRSTGALPGPDTAIYVADTLGETGLFYTVAPVVFVAGSLVPVGGHNPLEAAHFDCAVLFGPLMAKVAEIASAMAEAGAATRLADGPALGEAVAGLLADPDRQRRMATAGRRFAARQNRILDAVTDRLTVLLRHPAGTA